MPHVNFKNGQTLVEALVTVLFIAIAVIALIRFQSYLAYDNSLAQQKNEATILGIRQIEILREFQVLNNTTGYTSYQSIASGSTTATGTTTTYTIAWTVTQNVDPTYKSINLTVSWTDRNNTNQLIRLNTIIAGIDPQNSSAIM